MNGTCRSRTNLSTRSTGELRWAVNPPGLIGYTVGVRPELIDRVGALEQHLRLAQDELTALGDEASWMLREAESALALALSMIGDDMPEWIAAPVELPAEG